MGTALFSWYLGVTSLITLFLIQTGSLLVYAVALETWYLGKESPLRKLKIERTFSWKRLWYREAALLVTLGVIALLYWTAFRCYPERMLKIYLPFLKVFAPILLGLSLPYFALMDVVDPEEEDATVRLGKSIVTFKPHLTRFEFLNYVRSWLVKAFYLTLMQPEMVEKYRVLFYFAWDKLAGDPLSIYLIASTICYAIDLVYASAGYILNFKLFGTHTRTAEPTLLGWVVTLACYWPIWGLLLYPNFFHYDAGGTWLKVFTTGSVWWWIWAVMIVGLEGVYAMSTVTAGIRFSNLTYRGLWKTGPYRFMAHPAYVAKNLSWWLISLPFIVNSGVAAMKCTLMLLGVNFIYYLRAKTEERHLLRYPEYQEYFRSMGRKYDIIHICKEKLWKSSRQKKAIR